ncbi:MULTISPECIES: hypothetical protein [unclassified Micromonospora]|uniref:hypothetical protein n=1 Tax=unclassified Micromonospora TaxID=2617518 RepID=UPI00332F09C4
MRGPRWVADVVDSYAGDDRPAHIYRRDDATSVTLTRGQLRDAVSRRAGAARWTPSTPSDRDGRGGAGRHVDDTRAGHGAGGRARPPRPRAAAAGARLRLFVNATHTEAQIESTVEALAQEHGR